jgi:hypothetical protein
MDKNQDINLLSSDDIRVFRFIVNFCQLSQIVINSIFCFEVLVTLLKVCDCSWFTDQKYGINSYEEILNLKITRHLTLR